MKQESEVVDMKSLYFLVCCYISLSLLQGCGEKSIEERIVAPVKQTEKRVEDKEVEATPIIIIEDNDAKPINFTQFERRPTQWGEDVTGVKKRMKTEGKKLALTFDACGGTQGSDYDEILLSFLQAENIPATLFVNERWIYANEKLFLELASHPLFQIENHGSNHKPLSVAGGEAWGIQATSSPQEVYDEIMQNHETVKALTGKEMTLFRSGTAYYDEVAVELVKELGYEVVNFDVLGDAGATYSSEQVKNALLSAKSGSIVLLHMNQPESGTAEGVMQAVPILREQGFEFVRLEKNKLE